MFPFREMPREEGFTCKKRQHPDGLHLSTSSPKRLSSVSEAVLDSSIDSAIDSQTPLRHSLDSAHESLWNLASSAVITSDCSTSMCAGHSTMCTDVVSSKPPSFGSAHSQTPSDSSSYNPEVSKSARGSSLKENGKGIWMYRSSTSKFEAESECSDVTYSRSSISRHEPEGVSSSGKAMHVISRREKSSLNPKWGMDEAWAQDAFGYGDIGVPEKRLESNISLHSMSERREYTYSSMACESGSSCATGESCMEEIRSNQGSCRISGSVCKEPFVASPIVHTNKAEASVGPRAHERSGSLDHFNTQGHLSFDVDMHSSFTHKGKTEELSPAYVLSSGRLSLEEEARLGRRAPTIDHDFEEYFSSLMLE